MIHQAQNYDATCVIVSGLEYRVALPELGQVRQHSLIHSFWCSYIWLNEFAMDCLHVQVWPLMLSTCPCHLIYIDLHIQYNLCVPSWTAARTSRFTEGSANSRASPLSNKLGPHVCMCVRDRAHSVHVHVRPAAMCA